MQDSPSTYAVRNQIVQASRTMGVITLSRPRQVLISRILHKQMSCVAYPSMADSSTSSSALRCLSSIMASYCIFGTLILDMFYVSHEICFILWQISCQQQQCNNVSSSVLAARVVYTNDVASQHRQCHLQLQLHILGTKESCEAGP